jgi:hypothetical protein
MDDLAARGAQLGKVRDAEEFARTTGHLPGHHSAPPPEK